MFLAHEIFYINFKKSFTRLNILLFVVLLGTEFSDRYNFWWCHWMTWVNVRMISTHHASAFSMFSLKVKTPSPLQPVLFKNTSFSLPYVPQSTNIFLTKISSFFLSRASLLLIQFLFFCVYYTPYIVINTGLALFFFFLIYVCSLSCCHLS